MPDLDPVTVFDLAERGQILTYCPLCAAGYWPMRYERHDGGFVTWSHPEVMGNQTGCGAAMLWEGRFRRGMGGC